MVLNEPGFFQKILGLDVRGNRNHRDRVFLLRCLGERGQRRQMGAQMTHRFYLGIDPGITGAFALYDSEMQDFELWDMPLNNKGDVDAIDVSHIASYVGIKVRAACGDMDVLAIVEKVHSMPRQAGAFNFGLSTGILHGVLASHGIDMHLAPPIVWKPAMGLARRPAESHKDYKSRSRAAVKFLFPDSKLFDRAKDDGRAESLLLAVYGATKRKEK